MLLKSTCARSSADVINDDELLVRWKGWKGEVAYARPTWCAWFRFRGSSWTGVSFQFTKIPFQWKGDLSIAIKSVSGPKP
jgi:hypothetical protein